MISSTSDRSAATEKRRWPRAVTILPYVMLAFAALLTVPLEATKPHALIFHLVLSALAAVWMLWMFTLHPAWRERTALMAVFFTVLLAIAIVMVFTAAWFGFFTFTLYFYAAEVIGWPWRLPAVAVVAVLAGTSQAYAVPKNTVVGVILYLVIVAVNVVAVTGGVWGEWKTTRAHAERTRALEEVNEANRRLEATLAENAGLHEQLVTQAREAGVLDERQRMAREIHDTLAQGLTGIITQLQAAEQASEDPAGWRRHFEAATRLARESLTEARRSVDALRPEPLQTARLSEALAGVAERWSALHGVPVQVKTTGTARPMPPEAEFTLLRAAQEALANVARHAEATRVGLTLSYLEDEVALDVRDDGRGFDPAEPAQGRPRANGNGLSGGFGLVAMRQRVESLAGTLQIESEPGAGTAISACVPAASAQACT
jgi:signal transduction histidine kinase